MQSSSIYRSLIRFLTSFYHRPYSSEFNQLRFVKMSNLDYKMKVNRNRGARCAKKPYQLTFLRSSAKIWQNKKLFAIGFRALRIDIIYAYIYKDAQQGTLRAK